MQLWQNAQKPIKQYQIKSNQINWNKIRTRHLARTHGFAVILF